MLITENLIVPHQQVPYTDNTNRKSMCMGVFPWLW